MFHAISLRLACLARRFRDTRDIRAQVIAEANGWQVQRCASGTLRYRDPRFDYLADKAAYHAATEGGR